MKKSVIFSIVLVAVFIVYGAVISTVLRAEKAEAEYSKDKWSSIPVENLRTILVNEAEHTSHEKLDIRIEKGDKNVLHFRTANAKGFNYADGELRIRRPDHRSFSFHFDYGYSDYAVSLDRISDFIAFHSCKYNVYNFHQPKMEVHLQSSGIVTFKNVSLDSLIISAQGEGTIVVLGNCELGVIKVRNEASDIVGCEVILDEPTKIETIEGESRVKLYVKANYAEVEGLKKVAVGDVVFALQAK